MSALYLKDFFKENNIPSITDKIIKEAESTIIKEKVIKSEYSHSDFGEVEIKDMPAPQSYTGEDVAEFHVHGSRPLLKLYLDQYQKLKTVDWL